MVHNYYQQWGGEDASTEQELRLLRGEGHDVRFYKRHNDEIEGLSPLRKLLLFFEPTWSSKSYRELRNILQEFHPEIVHFHNFFPLISPGAYYACKQSGAAVIQTLRNYRLFCPVGTFFRSGRICEECIRHSLLRSVRYGCYHNSRLQTSSVALMLLVHRLLKTWSRKVDTYIALTEFSRGRFIDGGIPGSSIVVRPNFLEKDPGPGEHNREYAVFVGRLSSEKGLRILLEAWRSLSEEIPLKVIGDGPLRPWLEDYVDEYNLKEVDLLGFIPPQEVFKHLKKAQFLIMPSIWYETFGRTVIEAYATQTPVVVSNMGAMASLVKDGKTGLLFEAGDSSDLSEKVKWLWLHQAHRMKMAKVARAEFKEKYTADRNYSLLLEIYKHAVEILR
jgi:glycosyltransferase involved in cell wall biosynthesis